MKSLSSHLVALAVGGCATVTIHSVTVSGKTLVFQGLISTATARDFRSAVENQGSGNPSQ